MERQGETAGREAARDGRLEEVPTCTRLCARVPLGRSTYKVTRGCVG